MQISEEFDLSVEIESAWRASRDVETLVSCIPDAELYSDHPDEGGEFPGRIVARFGPKAIPFTGTVSFKFDDMDHVIVVAGRGFERRSRTRVNLELTVGLVDLEGHSTHFRIDANVEVTGPLAGLMTASARKVSKNLVDEFQHRFLSRVDASVNGSQHVGVVDSDGPEGEQLEDRQAFTDRSDSAVNFAPASTQGSAAGSGYSTDRESGHWTAARVWVWLRRLFGGRGFDHSRARRRDG